MSRQKTRYPVGESTIQKATPPLPLKPGANVSIGLPGDKGGEPAKTSVVSGVRPQF